MNTPQSSLFRQEVLAARSDTSAGPALTIRPVGAGPLTLFFAALCAAVLLLLVLGSYTKKERVQGVVRPLAAVAAVVTPSAGVVQRVHVSEGQQVKAGQPLVEIGNDRYSDEGNTATMLEDKLSAQRERMQAQGHHQSEAHQAALTALAQRIEQARYDLATLDEETRLLTQQIDASQAMLRQLEPLMAERIISSVQIEQQRQTLLEQTARLQGLKRQRAAAAAAMAQASGERARLSAIHASDSAGLAREQLALEQEQLQRRGARVVVLRAPIDGVVSGLMASPGLAVPAQQALASVMPVGSTMEAVLHVPSTAIGFIREGQAVRVSYDAFPYQRFGQYHGTVRTVSRTDVSLPHADSRDPRAYFLVRVALQRPTVEAYGKAIPLKAGQTLTADIEIDRQRLIRWMLDPLYAFGGKL